MFTHLGVEVIDERPYEVTRSDGVRVYVYDFGLRTRVPRTGASVATATRGGLLFQNAVRAVWTGAAESTASTRSVLGCRA
jgi:glutamate dehydrogenase